MIVSNLSTLAGKRLIRMSEISRQTGISRTTLLNLYNKKSKGLSFEVLSKLCNFFNCSVGELLEYVDEAKKE